MDVKVFTLLFWVCATWQMAVYANTGNYLFKLIQTVNFRGGVPIFLFIPKKF